MFVQSNQKQFNTIESNSQLMYNTPESESGINGNIQRLQRLSGQFDTNIFKESSKQEAKEY